MKNFCGATKRAQCNKKYASMCGHLIVYVHSYLWANKTHGDDNDDDYEDNERDDKEK